MELVLGASLGAILVALALVVSVVTVLLMEGAVEVSFRLGEVAHAGARRRLSRIHRRPKHVPREIAPSAAPTSRGDEPTPAEEG